MKVFDLNEVMSHEAEANYYQEQLDVDIEARWAEFVCYCEEYKMDNILKKKEAWHKLSSLWAISCFPCSVSIY